MEKISESLRMYSSLFATISIGLIVLIVTKVARYRNSRRKLRLLARKVNTVKSSLRVNSKTTRSINRFKKY